VPAVRTNNALPAVAAVTTGVTTWLATAGTGHAAWAGIAQLLLLPAPWVLPVLWGLALLLPAAPGAAVAAALIWLVVALVAAPTMIVASLAGYVLAGLAAGWAIGRYWRWDGALGAVMLVLAPALIWAVHTVGVAETLAVAGEQMSEALEGSLPAETDEATRIATRAQLEHQVEMTLKAAAAIWPATMVLGLFGHAASVLALITGLMRWLRTGFRCRPLTPFLRWRVPFYWIWILAVGLALVVTRSGELPKVGLNVVLAAGFVLAMQGLAVLAVLINGIGGPAVRLAFWVIASLFFAPIILPGGVVLGIVDQWLDLRRLDTPPTA